MPFTPPSSGVGNDVTINEINSATLITEAEGIPSNDNDTTLPTSAAVKDYVDDTVAGLPGSPVDSVNGEIGAVLLDADDISDAATTNKFTTASDISKLAGIESGADVTDATNVEAAGAVMESDIGTTVQAYDAELAAIAGLTSEADALAYFTGLGTAALTPLSSFIRGLLDDVNSATARGTLGLGTIATQDSNNASITGGSLSGLTSLALSTGNITHGKVSSPTITNVTNVAASTIQDQLWLQIGKVLVIGGRFTLDPTSASVATEIGISIPVSSTTNLFTYVSGAAACSNSALLSAGCEADITNNRIAIRFINGSDVANRNWHYSCLLFVNP